MTVYMAEVYNTIFGGRQTGQALLSCIQGNLGGGGDTNFISLIQDGHGEEGDSKVGGGDERSILLVAKDKETLKKALNLNPALSFSVANGAFRALIWGSYRGDIYPLLRKSWMKTKATVIGDRSKAGIYTRRELRHDINASKLKDRGYFILILTNPTVSPGQFHFLGFGPSEMVTLRNVAGMAFPEA